MTFLPEARAGALRRAHLATAVARAVQRTRDRSSFPTVEGALTVDGVDAPMEIVRDRWGVPHVLASSSADAFFGHGFVHAQDRLFRMEGARRLASGRLSEVAGRSSLASDRLMRRIGLARAARRDAEQLSPEGRTSMQAYAAGVNAGAAVSRALPPEFALLGDRFEPWTVQDTMVVGRLVAFGFAGNWVTELVREELTATLGPERASALDPVHPSTFTVTGAGYLRMMADLRASYAAAVRAGLPASLASNAWAVSPARSETGRPLLASDPHVDVSLPGLFHVAHLRGGDVDVIGAGLPGIPGVVIGHGRHLAWGITAGMADVADCYVEEFESPGSPRYRTHEGWTDAEEITERIEVAGEPPVHERVLVTRHGPVVGPAIDEPRAVALRSSAVDGGEMASAFLALSRARSLDEAEVALDGWSGATFNFVLASTAGEIGYRFAGQVPQRSRGAGLLPRHGPASTGAPPYLPPASLPRLRDPEDGLVVSANNAPGSEHELGEEWSEPRRWERIRELLEARAQHSLDSFRAIQDDRYSANLSRLRDTIIDRAAAPPSVRLLLVWWDGHLDADSAAGALLVEAYRLLALDLSERLAGPLAREALGAVRHPLPANSAFAYRSQAMHIEAVAAASAPWFESEADRDRRLRGAVSEAVRTLQARCGEAPADWRLGAIQRLPLRHALQAVPGLGRWWSRGTRPFGGDVNTVVQAQGLSWETDGTVHIAPGYRQLLDVGDWDRSLFMLPTGNSGIPGHPRYDDCIEEYVAGAYRPLVFTEAAIRDAAEATLVLEPLRAGGAAT